MEPTHAVCLFLMALSFWAGRRNGRWSLLHKLGIESGLYDLGELKREIHIHEWRWLKDEPE